MADIGPVESDELDDEPAFTAADFDPAAFDAFTEVDTCEARLTLTAVDGTAYELLCEVDDGEHVEHEATLRWCTEPHDNSVEVPRAQP